MAGSNVWLDLAFVDLLLQLSTRIKEASVTPVASGCLLEVLEPTLFRQRSAKDIDKRDKGWPGQQATDRLNKQPEADKPPQTGCTRHKEARRAPSGNRTPTSSVGGMNPNH
ncbi:hypothetical protein PI126_g24907 [Phytophthora idaei]|nr:hypothetical protein PI126_g24907 [Phytophthora idaei]